MIKLLLLGCFFLASSLSRADAFETLADANEPDGWAMDESMGFHIAYLDPGSEAHKGNFALRPWEFTPDYTPDNNRRLDQLLRFGFPVPDMGQRNTYLNVFEKNYHFPKNILDANRTTKWLREAYLLDDMETAQNQLNKAFSPTGKHLRITQQTIAYSGRVFTPAKPLMPLRLPPVDAQKLFNSRIVYSSLFVRPRGRMIANFKEDDPVDHSREGVINFRNDLVKLYAKSMKRIQPMNPNVKSSRFMQMLNAPKDRCRFVMLTVPKAPFRIENYRDLPMPEDPNHKFLTSQLLVRAEFFEGAKKNECPDFSTEADVRRGLTLTKKHMLEVASVVQLD